MIKKILIFVGIISSSNFAGALEEIEKVSNPISEMVDGEASPKGGKNSKELNGYQKAMLDAYLERFAKADEEGKVEMYRQLLLEIDLEKIDRVDPTVIT